MDDERVKDDELGEGDPKADAGAAGSSPKAGQPESLEVPEDAVSIELERLQQETERLRELYLRKLADFDNYRKRQEREMGEFRRFANAELLRDCLPVLDNLERALASPGSDDGGLRTGLELVLRQFKDVLGRHGLVGIDPLGEEFDPAVHEAVSRQETRDAAENTVVEVLQKGYLLGEKLLRPALVVVAAAPQSGSGMPALGGGDEP
jgi:molecular chaperone GrpE